jgi:hypothetical protein
LDIEQSNQYKVRAEVNKIKTHFTQSANDNIAKRYDLHRIEFDAERLQFSHSLLADNTYLLLVAEHVEDGVHGPNPMLRELQAVNQWPVSTLLLGRSNSADYLHEISSSGK